MTTNQQISIISNIILDAEESKETRKLLKKLHQLQMQQIDEEVAKIPE